MVNKINVNLTKSDQIIISCEKQKTPSLPPFRVPSKILPESATMFSPSKILEIPKYISVISAQLFWPDLSLISPIFGL